MLITKTISANGYRVDMLLSIVYKILDMLDNISPVVNPNLYKIYCSEFNKEVSIEDSDSFEVPPKYELILKKYIYDNLFSRLKSFVDDIEMLISSDISCPTAAIPTAAKTALDDTFVSNIVADAADAIDPVVRLKCTLLENHRAMINMHQLPVAEDIVNLDKEIILDFIKIVNSKIDNLWSFGNVANTIAEDTRTKFRSTIDYVKALLCILLYGVEYFARDNCAHMNYFIENISATTLKHNIQLFYKYSHLPLSCAICIYPGMVLNIKQDKARCSITSDSFNFLKLSALYDFYKDTILKEFNNAIKQS